VLPRVEGLSHTYSPETTASRKLTASDQTFSQALTKESSTTGSQVSAANSGDVQFFGGWTAAGTTHATQAPLPTPFDPKPPAATAAASETQASAAQPAPFVPQFETNVQVVSAYGDAWPLNPDYFATQQTAQYMADKFGTGKIVQDSLIGTGGPYAETADPYDIVLANGAKVNAGLLADYYVRMPQAQFPGLADTMIQMAVAQAEKSNG